MMCRFCGATFTAMYAEGLTLVCPANERHPYLHQLLEQKVMAVEYLDNEIKQIKEELAR